MVQYRIIEFSIDQSFLWKMEGKLEKRISWAVKKKTLSIKVFLMVRKGLHLCLTSLSFWSYITHNMVYIDL